MAPEPIRDAAGLPSAFAYEHTDVPAGMTLTAWRRQRAADRGRATRSSSRPTVWRLRPVFIGLIPGALRGAR